MFTTIRNRIALLILLFCIIATTLFIIIKETSEEKINVLISGMEAEKSLLLDKVINLKSKSLNNYANDYSYWDEMVNFVKKTDSLWAVENINGPLNNYNINFIWAYNANLKLVYSTSGETNRHITQLPFDDEILKKISIQGKLQHFFATVDSELIEISMATVHPSFDKNRITQIQGYYFAGRLWSKNYLAEIGELTQSTIELNISNNAVTTGELEKKGKYQSVINKLLYSWDNKPIARITLVSESEIAQKLSNHIDNKFILSWLIPISIIFIFLLFFWEHVYLPLGKISKSLKNNDPSYIHKLLTRKNEFGQLSILINDFFNQKKKLKDEITERKQAEFQLRKLSLAIEQSPASIIITDSNEIIEYVNSKFIEVTGYNPKDIIGKNARILFPDEITDEEYEKFRNTVSSGEIWQGDIYSRKKSGERFYESAVISPLLDDSGSITSYLAIKEDISERKRNELLQKTLFEIANKGSVSDSLEDLIKSIRFHLGKLIDASNFYLALYDESTDSFALPHFQDQKDGIAKFPAKKTLTAYVLRTRKSFLGTEDKINQLKRNGLVESIGEPAKIWLGVPLIVDNKAFGVFVVQSYDNEKAFTEQDKEMLEFVSHEISHTIQRKKAEEEIKGALEKAEESDRLKSAFLANMSHEIRTPLNSILGFSELLINPGTRSINLQNIINIIRKSGKELLTIINNILDFSLLETGQIKVIRNNFPVEKVLSEIYHEFEPRFLEKGIEFRLKTESGQNEIILKNDQIRFRQIISNLVSNALKFTRLGFVEIGFTKENMGVCFYVKDTGIGVSDYFRDEIFEGFRQSDKSKTRQFGGNGLGLAISKNLVEIMGGRIWFESETGKGSVFYVFLPF